MENSNYFEIIPMSGENEISTVKISLPVPTSSMAVSETDLLKKKTNTLMSYTDLQQSIFNNKNNRAEQAREFTKAEKVCRILNMMKNGLKVEEIAVHLGVSCKTIYRICEKDICNGDKIKYKELLKNRRFHSRLQK
jgi:DNA-binding NarL/FixJ family response regulator